MRSEKISTIELKVYNSGNAVEFFLYSEIYNAIEIKKFVKYLYDDYFYIIGLENFNTPVGFIAVERRMKTVHICRCVFVRETFRNKGSATRLLRAALEKSTKEGIEGFYINYFEDQSWTSSAKRLYKNFGFEKSDYVRKIFLIDKTEIKKGIDNIEDKYGRYLKVDDNYVIKRVFELNDQERNKIESQLGKSIPHNFYPLIKGSNRECSSMIFINEEPCGWIIFTNYGNQTLYIHQLFIKTEFRNCGLFFPLFCYSFQNAPEAIKKIFFYVNGDNKNMLGLFRLFEQCSIKKDCMVEMVKSNFSLFPLTTLSL